MPRRLSITCGALSLAVTLLALVPVAGAQSPAVAGDSVSPLTGVRVPIHSSGASVGVIDSAEIVQSGARSLSELLMARVPGLSVRHRGGLAAEGSEVYSRGVVTSAGADMMLIVDGVRADGMQGDAVPGTQVTISRLDDLVPGDVQRIEVLRGPAAAALYGLGAGRGVIIVTTRRGGTGPLGFDVSAGTGLTQMAATFPANYQLTSGAAGQLCNPRIVNSPAGCTPTTLYSWNPLEDASPFRAGRATSARLALSGTTLGTQTFVGMNSERIGGVTSDDWQSRLGLRASVARELPGALTISAQGSYLERNASVVGRGDYLTTDAVIPRGLFGSAYDDSLSGYRPVAGNWPAALNPEPATVRVTSALRLGWHALPWLDVEVLGGQDRVRQHAMRTDWMTGNYASSSAFADRWGSGTMHVGATARYGGAAGTALESTVAYEDVRLRDTRVYADSVQGATGAMSPTTTTYSELRSRTQDAMLRQHLSWRDLIDVNAGARWPVGRGVTSPLGDAASRSADASLRLPRIREGVELRLRAAAGRTILVSPGITIPGTTTPFGGYGYTFSGVGSRELRTRAGEIEGGIDATFTSGARLELTWYGAHNRDVLLGDGSTYVTAGNPYRFGDIDSHGVELLATAQPLRGERLSWHTTVSLSVPRATVVSASSSSYPVGFDVGYPLQSYWTNAYSWADSNGDGFISRREVQTGNPPSQYAGSFNPTVELGFRNAVTLPGRLTVAALLDYRGGQYRFNQTEQERCGTGNCAELQDPSLSLEEQARWMAIAVNGTPDIEPASFFRLREVTLEWTAPEAAARLAGGASLSVRLVGQNLLTWTRYPGIDPEVSTPSYLYSLVPVDRMQAPMSRSVSVELHLATR